MNAQDLPLTQLLDGAKQFIVPIFQRDYSWGTKHCQQLWNDILRVGGDPAARAHFLGSVVYIAAEDNQAAIPRWLLIDGQQRLTSLTQALSGDGVVATKDSRGKLCDQITAMLGDVGIHLTRRNDGAQAMALRIARFNSPLFLMSFAPPQPHADNVITLLLGTRPEFAEGRTTLPLQGGLNFGRYSNPRIDDLLPILVGEVAASSRSFPAKAALTVAVARLPSFGRGSVAV